MKSILLKRAINKLTKPYKKKVEWVNCGVKTNNSLDNDEEEQ